MSDTKTGAATISIGIVGCGAVTHTNYAQTLVGRDAYAVRHVFDLDEKQAASAARLFGAYVTPLDRLVAESDVVIIGTPPTTHAALVRECLRPGNTVICEKPFMTTSADARSVVEAAATAGSRLYVGHFRRAYPQVELARNLIRLGVIGDVTGFRAREGGRFTWHAVSNYTMRDAAGGGVLWDTGSHTLDMTLFAAGLDESADPGVEQIRVERDRPEPSHAFLGHFVLRPDGRTVEGSLKLSRTEALPNMVQIRGTRGDLAFVTDVDNRVRVTTDVSRVLTAERAHADLLECVDVQFKRILLQEGDDVFAARRFVGQIAILEALTNG